MLTCLYFLNTLLFPILDMTLHLFRPRPVLTYEKQPSNLTEVLKAKPVKFDQNCHKTFFGRAKLTDGNL